MIYSLQQKKYLLASIPCYKKVFIFRRYGTKCSGCGHGISPSDLVRKAREKVFHLNCFTCLVCRKQLSTGEELYVLDDNKFICKEDYLAGKAPTQHREYFQILYFQYFYINNINIINNAHYFTTNIYIFYCGLQSTSGFIFKPKPIGYLF